MLEVSWYKLSYDQGTLYREPELKLNLSMSPTLVPLRGYEDE